MGSSSCSASGDSCSFVVSVFVIGPSLTAVADVSVDMLCVDSTGPSAIELGPSLTAAYRNYNEASWEIHRRKILLTSGSV